MSQLIESNFRLRNGQQIKKIKHSKTMWKNCISCEDNDWYYQGHLTCSRHPTIRLAVSRGRGSSPLSSLQRTTCSQRSLSCSRTSNRLIYANINVETHIQDISGDEKIRISKARNMKYKYLKRILLIFRRPFVNFGGSTQGF